MSAGENAPAPGLSWTVGAVTIKRVLDLEQAVAYDAQTPFLAEARPEALARISWLYPHFVTPEGHLRISIHALLVEAPGLRLVVDTCVGADRARAFICEAPLETGFLERMRAAGWTPESVDMVVCTHLHADHVGWNTRLVDGAWVPTFPRARYLFGRRDFEHWSRHGQGEMREVLSDSLQPIVDAGLAELVEADHRLSAEVRLLPTPGHTPGHVSVLIESEGSRAVITGDAIHHPCQFVHPLWSPPFDFDQTDARATRRALLEDVADQPILVIGTHFAAPTAGYVERAGETYRFVV